jgi:hypothetical protein
LPIASGVYDDANVLLSGMAQLGNNFIALDADEMEMYVPATIRNGRRDVGEVRPMILGEEMAPPKKKRKKTKS